MRQAVLGSLTIGQALRPDLTPIIVSHVPTRCAGCIASIQSTKLEAPAAGARLASRELCGAG